jgi:small subunit ribosomal protein S17
MDTENTDNTENVEEVEAAEAGTTGEAEAAETAEAPDAPETSETDDAAEAPAPAAPALTRAQERAQARQREASARPSRTPEERQAERVEVRKAKATARSRRRVQEREKARAGRTEVPPTPPVERDKGSQKVRQGIVVSAKPDKTITVRIDTARRHPRYEKIVRSSTTLHAHDETNDAGEGDTVRIVESRPLSRLKRWRLDEVLERAR